MFLSQKTAADSLASAHGRTPAALGSGLSSKQTIFLFREKCSGVLTRANFRSGSSKPLQPRVYGVLGFNAAPGPRLAFLNLVKIGCYLLQGFCCIPQISTIVDPTRPEIQPKPSGGNYSKLRVPLIYFKTKRMNPKLLKQKAQTPKFPNPDNQLGAVEQITEGGFQRHLVLWGVYM